MSTMEPVESDQQAPLHLPPTPRFRLTSGSFEIPQTTVTINLRPHLAGQIIDLLAEAVRQGVTSEWFRPEFERTAEMVVASASTHEYMEALIEVAALAHASHLISSGEIDAIRTWAEEAATPPVLPRPAPVEQRRQWDEARDVLQTWLDGLDMAAKKKSLRQRSQARVACAECHSMLAWLVLQSGCEFLVLARGDNRPFEVAHAVGEYGGYARGRCGRKGGRTWVLHADYLRHWLDEGNSDVGLRHTDKGL